MNNNNTTSIEITNGINRLYDLQELFLKELNELNKQHIIRQMQAEMPMELSKTSETKKHTSAEYKSTKRAELMAYLYKEGKEKAYEHAEKLQLDSWNLFARQISIYRKNDLATLAKIIKESK